MHGGQKLLSMAINCAAIAAIHVFGMLAFVHNVSNFLMYIIHCYRNLKKIITSITKLAS